MGVPLTPLLCAPSDADNPFGNPMASSRLVKGLKKLNPNFYCPNDTVFGYIVQGSGQVGLYLGDPANDMKMLMTTMPAGMVPEFTQIGPGGVVLEKGWRAVLTKLVKAGVVGQGEVEREFRISLSPGAKDRSCEKCMVDGIVTKTDGGLCTLHGNVRSIVKTGGSAWA